VPSAEVLWALVGLAVLCTALGYLLYFEILKRAGATNLLLVTFLVPVSALLLGGLFLGEAVSGRQAWGMVLIGLGLACVDGRLLTRRQ
jgi:drug/metabolite transporter (DMT)-like permease